MLSPPIHYGMTILNKEAFKTSFQTFALRIPVNKIKQLQKALTNDILNLPRMHIDSLAPENKKLIEEEGLDIVKHTITLDYSYWTTEQILHSVIPPTVKEIPSSYTQVGHIAHMNLREELYPWKQLIGQVFLDKNKSITSVVNKINNIDTTYRFFKMEVLAGDSNMIAEVKESGCKFKFDFSKVYWNSRLHTEHDRLVQLFKKNQTVCDVFAGVGPFAVPASKKGVTVYANDLNPESYHWLKENKTSNKIQDNKLKIYNMDGREFIHQAVKDLASLDKTKWNTFDHFVMNLPETSIEFLDTFRGLYLGQKSLYDSLSPAPALPLVHCHCFTKSDDHAKDIAQRVEAAIGSPYDPSTSKLHWVRNVAPKKDMYCISFQLTPDMVFASTSEKRKQDVLDHPTSSEQVNKKVAN
ncbi:unnamed protein product [Cunninghamella echinulata]